MKNSMFGLVAAALVVFIFWVSGFDFERGETAGWMVGISAWAFGIVHTIADDW